MMVQGIRRWSSLSPFYGGSEHVILSAAGAKDLLTVALVGRSPAVTERRRREGSAFGRTQGDHWSPVVFKQVLRSRACRALAQDDNAARLRGERKKMMDQGDKKVVFSFPPFKE